MSKDILLPLRRLHGKMHEWAYEQRLSVQMRRYLKEPTGKKTIVPGTPEHENLGDSAIVLSQMVFLMACGFERDSIKEITFSEYQRLRKIIRRAVGKCDLIAQLGGGNMGSQWKNEENFHRAIVRDFSRNPMVIFPQTIYYSVNAQAEANASKTIYPCHQALTMVARERVSMEIMKELYPDTKVLLTPDIVLFANMDTFGAKPQERNGVLLCMRSDAEKSMTDADRQQVQQAVERAGVSYRYTDMYSDCAVTKENRAECVRKKMEELASARLIVTDRLHGMIFAAITGTPCIVFSNYNHKVRGTYEWIKYLPYIRYVETAAEAVELLPDMLAMGGQVYDNAPLMPHFEKLARVVRGYANN